MEETAGKSDKDSWFAIEAAVPPRGDCRFPARFTEIYLPHGAIVSGPTGQITVSGGQYRITYPNPFNSNTSWIVIYRDQSKGSQYHTPYPNAGNNVASTQPTQDTLQQHKGNQCHDNSSENDIFNHEAMVREASPMQDFDFHMEDGNEGLFEEAISAMVHEASSVQDSDVHMDDGNEGFFEEAMRAMTPSLAEDILPETSAYVVDAMDVDSTPEQQSSSQEQHSVDLLQHTGLDDRAFENDEYAYQKLADIFSAAIFPEFDPEQLRQAALDKQQLQNSIKLHAVMPTWAKPPSSTGPLVHPQTLHPQDLIVTKVMGPYDNTQTQSFLTIRLPAFHRVHSTCGTVTSFDLPFSDGTKQAGGGVYSFFLPTSPPVGFELPCLGSGVLAAFNLSKNHKVCRDGKCIPNTLFKGPHEVMYLDGDIEIVDCHDRSCLLKDACGQGEAPAPLDTHASGTDLDYIAHSQDTNDQVPEEADDQSTRDADDQSTRDASDESEEATDGEWDYLPKHLRPKQHHRPLVAVAKEILRPHRDWLYNTAKKEKEAEDAEDAEEEEEDDDEDDNEEQEEEEAKDRDEEENDDEQQQEEEQEEEGMTEEDEAEEERKRIQKEERKRESERLRKADYREKTRRKRERDRWAQKQREADERELAALMQQCEAANAESGGTKLHRPRRRTARAAVDYREKVAILSSSSDDSDSDSNINEDDSNEDSPSEDNPLEDEGGSEYDSEDNEAY